MKSITVHNIDNHTAELVSEKAKEWGLSQNKTIQRLLRKSLGISEKEHSKKQEFLEFFGLWDAEDEIQFKENINDLGNVSEEDWDE